MADLLHITNDLDSTTIPAALEGVKAGVAENIPRSLCMTPKPKPPEPDVPNLVWCDGNWQSADVDRDITTKLVDNKIRDDFTFVA